jgi:HTH-type transcriptional regulator/antitoxin HigA
MPEYKVLNSKRKIISTDVGLHPGEVIAMELLARDIKKIDFAAELGIRPGHLSELLQGKRNISAALAIRIENLLGIDAEYWMRLQVYFDLFIERNKKKSAA